ncbi:MAG: hypothetical protein RLZZ15_22 [Verrucomicrobiota bacterium]
MREASVGRILGGKIETRRARRKTVLGRMVAGFGGLRAGLSETHQGLGSVPFRGVGAEHWEPRRGEKSKAQGNALGNAPTISPSPERAKAAEGVAPSGRKFLSNPNPRALPWAVYFRPFGASELAAIDPLETAKNSVSFLRLLVLFVAKSPWFGCGLGRTASSAFSGCVSESWLRGGRGENGNSSGGRGLPVGERRYSARSATSGSMRLARSEGSRQASTATTAKSIVTPA